MWRVFSYISKQIWLEVPGAMQSQGCKYPSFGRCVGCLLVWPPADTDQVKWHRCCSTCHVGSWETSSRWNLDHLWHSKAVEAPCCTQNCRKIGQEKAKALQLFHAITGCDTVSFIGVKGGKTAWDVWNVYPVLTNVLCRLMLLPERVEDTFERFVALLYNQTSAIVKANPARKDLFLKKA